MDNVTASALGFIGAPALLTNAISVLLLSTANRLARSVTRAREIAKSIAAKDPKPAVTLPRQLALAEHRVLLTVWAMSVLYMALGAFAAATLLAVVGELQTAAQIDLLRTAFVRASMATGGLGFVGLIVGAALLTYESSLAYRMLKEEAADLREQAYTAGTEGTYSSDLFSR